MTTNELKELFAQIASSQAKTDTQIARMEAGIERVNKRLGSIGENQGDISLKSISTIVS